VIFDPEGACSRPDRQQADVLKLLPEVANSFGDADEVRIVAPNAAVDMSLVAVAPK
jgi:hypothetical protein